MPRRYRRQGRQNRRVRRRLGWKRRGAGNGLRKRRGTGRRRFTKRRRVNWVRRNPRKFKRGNSAFYTTQHTLITCPEDWSTETGQQYQFAEIRHKPAESGFQRWGDGNAVTPPTQSGSVAYFIASDDLFLRNARTIYEKAALQGINVRIEWLGARIQNQFVSTYPGQVGGEGMNFSMANKKHGTSLMVKMCHERLDRQRDDGVDGVAMHPADMLGLNRMPILFQPDRIDKDAGRGTQDGDRLQQSLGLRTLRFTPERRFHNIHFKPQSMPEKAAAVLNLQNVQWAATGAAGFDNDMRMGCLWLGQQLALAGLTAWQPGTEGTVSFLDCDFFRITYEWKWRLFGHKTLNAVPTGTGDA